MRGSRSAIHWQMMEEKFWYVVEVAPHIKNLHQIFQIH